MPGIGIGLNLALGGGGGVNLLALNDRLVYFGTSITAANYVNSAPPDQFFTVHGFDTWAQASAGSRLYVPPGGNKGVSADLTSDMIARISTVTALNPKCVIIDGPTNDVAGGIAAATIQANLTSIFSTLLTAGTNYIVVTTILPRSGGSAFTGPQETVRTTVNAWLLALTNPRIKVINEEAVFSWSGGTGFSDGVHPNSVGAYPMGLAVGPTLAAITSPTEILASAVNTLSINPTMAGTAGTNKDATSSGVVATGFQLDNSNGGGLTCVGSISTLNGNPCQRITVSGTYTGTVAGGKKIDLNSFVATSLVAGDTIEHIAEMQAASLANIAAINCYLLIFNAAFGVLAQAESLYPTDQLGYPGAAGRLTFRTPPATIQAGIPAWQSFGCNIFLKDGTAISVGGVLDFGRNCIRKIPPGA